MDIRDYKKILDAITTSAVYVIREDDHGILYYNKRVKEVTPNVCVGACCHELWKECCANCPLLTIGDKEESRSVSNGSFFGDVVDITAARIRWADQIPAFIITVSPCKETVSGVYHKIMHVNLSTDTYDMVEMSSEKLMQESQKGVFSDWTDWFIQNGGIYQDDVERFSNFIHPEKIQKAMQDGRGTLTCSYRCRTPEGIRWNMIEVVHDTGYSEENQTIIIFIKDVQDVLKESLEREEISIRMQEVVRSLGTLNFGIYAIDLHSGEVNPLREDGKVQDEWTSRTLLWEDVMRLHLAANMHYDYRKVFTHKFSLENLRKSGDTGAQKLEMLCQWDKNGEYHYVSVTAYFDKEQRFKKYAVIALQDVDERMRQEINFSKQELQMAAILKSKFKIITTVHLKSGQCERTWLSENEMLKKVYVGDYTHYFHKALSDVVHPEDRKKFAETLGPEHLHRQAESTEKYKEEICQYRMMGKSIQWLEQCVIYIRRGGEVQVNILERDITKEKIKEQMQLETARVRVNIIRSLSSMFFATYYGNLEENTFSPVMQLKEVGKVLGDGYCYEDGLRIYAERFIHPDDREEYLDIFSIKNMRKSLKPEQPYVTFSYRKLLEQPGNLDNYGWVRATSVLAETDEKGQAKLFVYAAQDITKSKVKELRGQQALQAACEAADRANASKSEFLSRMSHDLRTPMNGIMGMIKIAGNYINDSTRLQECMDKINESSELLMSLVNKMLDMSQIESGNVELETNFFGLSEMIENVRSVILPSANAKGLGLEIHPMKIEHEYVIGDQQKIQQVFLHILENSMKYTPTGGLLELSVTEQESREYSCGSYEFVVKDNGIGMDDDFIPHIFEPFSRAQDSRVSKIEGTGLGMTIAQNIVSLMGGHIVVESKRGCGTKFTVSLLLRQHNQGKGPNKAADLDKGAAAEEDFLSTDPFRGRRILVVEDNELNREIAMEIIGQTGAMVECAENGQEGLDRFAEMPEGYYDLLFMDIQMPVMNGYEAAQAIRKLPRADAASVPILALSANAFAEDIAASRAAGMNEHLTKPLDISRLMASMHYWLDGDKGKAS
ncbi:hybrid sensor histidine kinase/response regulator [Parablautia muri]|uniref:Stage 0 sporulation protein A homolog n=1 Tax=Parablautia muri TaxID=2320879 RepID=A0A9X5BEP7_9FIRM|nr:PAS domain-containing hybrid sensor histidine kinase/response regulator [Parablautia muri]NBJ92436.1 PAS domain-containing sensor histidine kinase [Parablautia muri]